MSSNKRVPHVVSITVYGAKGLKSKKDKHKFCVIFGIGKSKYRTDVIEDLFDNPVFNKEVEITVDNLDLDLKFKVTEKNEKDVLGQVIVPLYELGEQSTSSPHKVPLRPHKNCPNPQGMLVFEAWLMEKVEKIPPKSASLDNLKAIKATGISSGLKKLKDRIAVSGKPSDEKNRRNSLGSLLTLKSQSSASSQDVRRKSVTFEPMDVSDRMSSLSPRRHSLCSDKDFLDTISALSPRRHSVYLDKVSEFSCPRPEVTSVSPKSGPETGGTILTIRGSNLGQNHEDVVTLNVCGSDVLETLEYISPWKLQCKTLPWNPCVGNVSIETLSGGRGISLVEFAFDEVEKPKTGNNSNSYFTQSDVSRESKSEAGVQSSDDHFNSNDEYEFAFPYSEGDTLNCFKVDDLGVHQVPSGNDAQSDKAPRICSGEDGVIRLSVGGNESKLLNNEYGDDTMEMENRKLSMGLNDDNMNDGNLSPVSNEVFIKNNEKRNDEDEFVSKVKINHNRVLIQNGINSSEISNWQDKHNGKTVTPHNGATVKLPPPVVEIQPMRITDDKNIGSSQGKGLDGSPPQKPPRQLPGRSNSGQNDFDQTTLSRSSERSTDQDNVLSEMITNKDNEQIRDLEMELLKKTKEIEMLVKLKKSLTDENWRLKHYIEILVLRAIKICPEVLCADDDSFA